MILSRDGVPNHHFSKISFQLIWIYDPFNILFFAVSFFDDFFAGMDRCNWSDTALLYVARALSQIPPGPRLTQQHLMELRYKHGF